MVGVCVGRRNRNLQLVEKVRDVGILGIILMKSTIRNIPVMNVVWNGADEQALGSNPLCILLIAQYVTRTTISLPLPCLSSGAACSPDCNDTTYRGIVTPKSPLNTHTDIYTYAHCTPLHQKARPLLAGSV